MLIPTLAALALMLADAPAAAEVPPAPAATAPAAPAKPAIDPVTVEINTLLEPYKGKTGERLRARLGFSNGSRRAQDGEVVFWIVTRPQDMVCGMDPASLAMRCTRADPVECRLAIAFDTQNLVKTWAVAGAPEVCRTFVGKLEAG